MFFSTFFFLVDAREAVKGLIEIDSDLPVVNYDKIEDRNYRVNFLYAIFTRDLGHFGLCYLRNAPNSGTLATEWPL